jgi:hypothetical protein
MAIFLSFILGQAGIAVGALVEQNHFWVEYLKENMDEQELDLDVESKANAIVLIGCSLSSITVGCLVLLDAACSRCCFYQGQNMRRHDDEHEHERKIMGRIRPSSDPENAEGERRGPKIGEGKSACAVDDDGAVEVAGTASRVSDRNMSILPPWSRF